MGREGHKDMTLGVIGGMGPMATAYFMELIIRMTDGTTDQEHLPMIIYHSPGIADRTSYILGNSQENPALDIIRIGRLLALQGAACISIPCITAHYFHKELSEQIPIPIIHGIRETALELLENHVKRAGIMATDGTLQSRLFQTQLEEAGIEPGIPAAGFQKMVMELIYQDIKAGKPVRPKHFQSVSAHLWERGAEVIILGCTELSLIKKEFPIGEGYLDAMELLAQRSILQCRGRLKKEYQCLIR